MIVEFLKNHPPLESTLVHIIVVGVIVLWLWRRPGRTPVYLLGVLLLAYTLLSTPLGAGALVSTVGYGFKPIQTRAELQGVDTIVILGSGVETYEVGGKGLAVPTSGTALRALEAARLYRMIGGGIVIASGGIPYPEFTLRPESEAIRATLIAGGVPPDHVIEESESRNTRDEARILAPRLQARGARRFVLVTSPTHMRRSLAVFRAQGLDPIPSAAPTRSERIKARPLLLPNDESRHLSDVVLYDCAATLYYWWQGWSKPSPAAD